MNIDSIISINNNNNIVINNNNNRSLNFQLVKGYAKTMIETEMVCEDSNSSSGVSSEELSYPHKLNLDLSIGLPSQVSTMTSEKLKQEKQQRLGDQVQATKVTSHDVCLCYCQGFQSKQVCCCKAIVNTVTATVTDDSSNNNNNNNLYRFYRPMNI